jgi:hypothetical protein
MAAPESEHLARADGHWLKWPAPTRDSRDRGRAEAAAGLEWLPLRRPQPTLRCTPDIAIVVILFV